MCTSNLQLVATIVRFPVPCAGHGLAEPGRAGETRGGAAGLQQVASRGQPLLLIQLPIPLSGRTKKTRQEEYSHNSIGGGGGGFLGFHIVLS